MQDEGAEILERLVLARLHRVERRALADLAAAAEVSAVDMIPAILAAYLRLAKDAPGALPADPVRGLRARALQ
ncbi:hypothetical protein ACGYK5_17075 [Sulfitobacter sp. 1A16787]|uniref:hypothetical protein n=1 Tax=Sulfitobacter sp. 1A16787 TaxID=3368571 RepID=UPI003744D8B0